MRTAFVFAAIITAAVLIGGVLGSKADQDWSTFLIDHQCHKVSIKGITSLQGWKCNDGETYWR